VREMPGDLRIGWSVLGDCGRNSLGLAELVDLDHPRRDGAARGLPEHAAGEARRKEQVAERDEPPVAGLDASGTDALVPDLRRLLVGSLRFWCAATWLSDQARRNHVVEHSWKILRWVCAALA
jgi:hypothetical protein